MFLKSLGTLLALVSSIELINKLGAFSTLLSSGGSLRRRAAKASGVQQHSTHHHHGQHGFRNSLDNPKSNSFGSTSSFHLYQLDNHTSTPLNYQSLAIDNHLPLTQSLAIDNHLLSPIACYYQSLTIVNHLLLSIIYDCQSLVLSVTRH